MSIYYAAVDGDPLTTGEGSYTIANHFWGTIDDSRGAGPKRMIVIGDEAFCSVCKTVGEVTYGARLRRGRRVDCMGRDLAVGGDFVVCNCAVNPRIYVPDSRNFRIIDDSDNTAFARRSESGASSGLTSSSASHWIAFKSNERGNCEGLSCVAHFADGSRERGTFDSANTVRFERGDNGNACARVELVLDHSPSQSASVTESILCAAAR